VSIGAGVSVADAGMKRGAAAEAGVDWNKELSKPLRSIPGVLLLRMWASRACSCVLRMFMTGDGWPSWAASVAAAARCLRRIARCPRRSSR
jgi:hypothetical protein